MAAGAFSPEIPALFDSPMVTICRVMATQQAIDPVALNNKIIPSPFTLVRRAHHLDIIGIASIPTADIVSPRFTLDGDTSKTSFTLPKPPPSRSASGRRRLHAVRLNVTTVEPAAEVWAGRGDVVIGVLL